MNQLFWKSSLHQPLVYYIRHLPVEVGILRTWPSAIDSLLLLFIWADNKSLIWYKFIHCNVNNLANFGGNELYVKFLHAIMNVTMKNEDDHFSRTLSFVTDQHKKVSPPLTLLSCQPFWITYRSPFPHRFQTVTKVDGPSLSSSCDVLHGTFLFLSLVGTRKNI
jgi:hypothetical protein